MLRWLHGVRQISTRKAQRIAKRIEEETTHFPPPMPPTNECISIWKDGLSIKYYGGIHGYFKNQKFISMMSEIFDRVYNDVGLRLPKYQAIIPRYILYKVDEIDTKLNKDITDRIDKIKHSINVYELRQKCIHKTIHYEPSIANHCDDDYVFVDISPSKNKYNRAIIVRKPNGELDIADWDIRERMEVVFYGRDEQTYPYPSFTNSQIIRELSPTELIPILCYITYFIPPDSPLYHNAVGECYETICRKRGFRVIASTHFLIPFIYHCLMFSNNRLLYLANNISDRSSEALAILAKAFAMVNNKSNTYNFVKDNPDNNTELIKVFLDEAKFIYNNLNEQNISNQHHSSTDNNTDKINTMDEEIDEFNDIESINHNITNDNNK